MDVKYRIIDMLNPITGLPYDTKKYTADEVVSYAEREKAYAEQAGYISEECLANKTKELGEPSIHNMRDWLAFFNYSLNEA